MIRITILLLLWVLNTQYILAQFDPILDTIVCNTYNFPIPTGQGLSAELKYFTEPNGQGESYQIGDPFDETSDLYAYDCINGYETCFVITAIQTPPTFITEPEITLCTDAFFPVVEGENLTSLAAYYTERNGKGNQYFPGSQVLETRMYYLYDGIGVCSTLDSVFINIVQTPELLKVSDTIHCAEFILPEIQGYFLPECSYRDLNTNEIFYSGDVISGNKYLEIIADTAGCIVRDSFWVNEVDLGVTSFVKDTTVCGHLQINYDSLSFQGSNLFYWSSTNNRISEVPTYTNALSTRLYLSTSRTICFIDSIENTACSQWNCFDIEVLEVDSFRREVDTFLVCRNQEISFPEMVNSYYSGEWPDYYESFDGNLDDEWDPSAYPSGYYSFFAVRSFDPNCDLDNDTFNLVLHTVDDCTLGETEVVISDQCNSVKIGHYLRREYVSNDLIVYNGTLYNESFSSELSLDQFIDVSETDTLRFWYVFETTNGLGQDTVAIIVPPIFYQDIGLEIIGEPNMCYNDCISISFETEIPDSAKVFFANVDLWKNVNGSSIPVDSYTNIISSFSDPNEVSICFQDTSLVDTLIKNAIYLEDDLTEYFVIIPESSVYIFDNECRNENPEQTFYFSTNRNTQFLYQESLCFNETVEIEGQMFSERNRAGQVIISGGASNGCDSIIDVNLDFHEAAIYVEQRVFCNEDDFINFNCTRYDIYNPVDTVILSNASVLGCDSTIIINLNYITPRELEQELFVCSGDSLEFEGVFYQEGEFVLDTIKSHLGCDSLYTKYNVVNGLIDVIRDTTICHEGSFVYFGNTISDAGVYSDTLRMANGCDSLINSINVSVYPPSQIIVGEELSICSGESLEYLGIFYQEGQLVVDTLKNVLGCDSLYTTYDVVSDVFMKMIDTTICKDDRINLFGVTYSEPGVYLDTLRKVNGCDSVILNISLDVYSDTPIEINGDLSFCEGDETLISVVAGFDSIYLNGIKTTSSFWLNESGVYTIFIEDQNTCPLDTTITVVSHSNPSVDVSSINPESLEIGSYLNPEYSDDVVYYRWSPASLLDCSDCPSPAIENLGNGAFEIYVENEWECSDLDSLYFNIERKNFYIPNIINSNSSSTNNDVFYVQSDNSQINYEMLVYDRWGNLIFSKDDILVNDKSNAWQPSQNSYEGVFTYLIRINISGEQLRYAGTVTVI